MTRERLPKWSEKCVLDDGSEVLLRPVHPEDREEFRRAIARLSPESRFRRFLGVAVNDKLLDYLTHVDQKDHVAIVAIAESFDLKEEHGVGVARYVRQKGDPRVAEAAVTVVDDMQRKGLARILLHRLTEIAVANGVRAFRAHVLLENEPIRRILEQVGARVITESDGVRTYEVDLPRESRERSDLFQILLRAAGATRGFVESFLRSS